ncbi:MAG: YtxH domain-containing protein [Vicinamibacteria bacterium]
MANDNGGTNFFAGFLVGAALGAIAALLLAPKSGRELRESLAEEGRKLKDRAVDEGRRFVTESEEAETIRNAAKSVKETFTG